MTLLTTCCWLPVVQSLGVLTALERMLQKQFNFVLNQHYLRMDGGCSPSARSLMITQFNRQTACKVRRHDSWRGHDKAIAHKAQSHGLGSIHDSAHARVSYTAHLPRALVGVAPGRCF